MINNLKLSDIAKQCNGQLNGDAEFSRVCTDTRVLQKGDLYVALSGENFDGHDFVLKAVESGASAVVVARKPETNIPYLLVDDPLRAFGTIGLCNRQHFKGPLIALTGSTGKTTCKEMLASILSESGNVLATRGNFNNEVGVPKTLLEIQSEHEFAVIEMGASKQGDIKYLCQFAEPTISMITNAMPAHIEGFGSIDMVASTKGEIFKDVSSDTITVINADDKYAEYWVKLAGKRKILTFSIQDTTADIYASNVRVTGTGNLAFTLSTMQGSENIELPLLGRHNIANAVAASTCALAAGIELEKIKSGLLKVNAVSGRLCKTINSNGQIVIDDSYNANPGSVEAAIDVLIDCTHATTDKKISTCLILGTMNELGEQSLQMHQQVAAYAREQGVDSFISVGEYAPVMQKAFGEKGLAFKEVDDLLVELKEHTQCDVVLVKGSRSAHMETVANALMDSTRVSKKKLGDH